MPESFLKKKNRPVVAVVEVRLTHDELTEVIRAAEAAGASVEEMLRASALAAIRTILETPGGAE